MKLPRRILSGPAALSLLAGLAAALAHPPFGILPGLLGYGLLLATVDRAGGERPLRSAFWRAFLAGTAYFAVGCWWVAEAFFVDAAEQGWMAPFAVMLLAAGLGLFWGLGGLLYRVLRPGAPILKVLVFAGALSLLEWMRGHVLTGFAWNLPGETWKAGSAPGGGPGRRIRTDVDHARRRGRSRRAPGFRPTPVELGRLRRRRRRDRRPLRLRSWAFEPSRAGCPGSGGPRGPGRRAPGGEI